MHSPRKELFADVLLGNPGFLSFGGFCCFCFYLAAGFLRSSDRLKLSVTPHCRAGVYFPELLGPRTLVFRIPDPMWEAWPKGEV